MRIVPKPQDRRPLGVNIFRFGGGEIGWPECQRDPIGPDPTSPYRSTSGLRRECKREKIENGRSRHYSTLIEPSHSFDIGR